MGLHGAGDVPKLEVIGHRARLVLQRPDKRNRLEPADLEQIISHLQQIHNNSSVRVVTLEAEGPSWCSGYHLGALAEGERPQFDFGDVCDALAEVKVPTIAVLGGNVHGGGTDLAIACDLRVGSQEIVLGMPAARIGISTTPPDCNGSFNEWERRPLSAFSSRRKQLLQMSYSEWVT